MQSAVIGGRKDPIFFDFFCLGKKFLVFNLVSRNLKTKYRRSVFGLLWTLLNPLALTAIYYFVFKIVMNVRVPHYLTFMLSGVLLWSFFSATILEGMESLVGNFGLVSKVPIPVQVFPWVGAVTNLITLGLSVPIIVGVALLTDVPPSVTMLLFPFYGLALFLMAYSLALILSIAFVYLRDLRHLMGILLQVWFYATPVFYDDSMIPPKFHWVLLLNPVGMIFKGVHDTFTRGQWPSPKQVALVAAWTIAMTLAAIVFQARLGREVVGENLMVDTPVISVKNLTKRFTYWSERPTSMKTVLVDLIRMRLTLGQRQGFCALENISFDISKGEFVGIMGRNGAGKSTLLKLISGIYVPTSGTIEVRDRIAPLIELGAGFHSDLSGYENIFLNAAILGFGRAATMEALPKILEFSELGDMIYMPTKNYSSGMLVRLGFAIASHLTAPIILIDEVLAVGDAGFQEKCLRKIRELHEEGRTIVLITHAPGAVREHCNRCIVIDRHAKVYDGPAAEGVDVYMNAVNAAGTASQATH